VKTSKTNGLPKTSVCRKKIEYSHIFRDSAVIDPSKLSIDEKEHFIDSLYQLNSQIFDGVDRASFVSYVVDSPADWTRILIYKNNRKEWIGYCAVHRFNKLIFDRACVIFRAEAGVLREYRGRSHTLWFGFNEAIKHRIKHPFCALYYLGSFVHPSVLYMFSRYFSEYYPRADIPIPERIKVFMLELANIFHHCCPVNFQLIDFVSTKIQCKIQIRRFHGVLAAKFIAKTLDAS
jgi:hypothetical protein